MHDQAKLQAVIVPTILNISPITIKYITVTPNYTLSDMYTQLKVFPSDKTSSNNSPLQLGAHGMYGFANNVQLYLVSILK